MEEAGKSAVERRDFIRKAGMGGVAAAGLMAAIPAFATPAHADTTSDATLTDAGAGFHAGLSTFDMMGMATISRNMVTCAVGQMGVDTSTLPLSGVLSGILGKGFSGPFAMLMYSQSVTSYKLNRSAGTIRARGVLRSITKMGGQLIEDAESEYLAVGRDSRGAGADAFFLNYVTPFWKTPNPLATPSKYVSGWSQFGGNLIMGEVNVAR